MPITFEEKKKIFTLQTDHTTYQMMVTPQGFLLHLYYGKKTTGDMSYLLTFRDRGFSGNPYDVGADRTFSLDALPQEYPCQGSGDFRFTAFQMSDAKGVCGADLRYESHTILDGKYEIPELPAVHADEEKAQTLKIILADARTGMKVTLFYGVLPQSDVITRYAEICNQGDQILTVHKAYSCLLDFVTGNYDVIHFHGRHGMERLPERVPVITGNQFFGSRRGTSSHQHNPFVMLAAREATEDFGSVYGISLLYSGGFSCEVERDQYEQTRIGMGIEAELFSCELAKGEVLRTPEAAFSYTDQGFTELSHTFHKLIRDHICRGAYLHEPRPILINNWEATYFDFNGEKILNIARQAAKLGVEMLVLDDGWFGKRDDDNSGLGDWFVNEKKMGGPLKDVVEKVNAMGMKFGLWFEPEMVSEDSELYRTHPDWAYTIPGKKPVRSRNQLVLDFSRKEVVDAIYEQIHQVIASANIAYVKLDMNRSIADVYTATQERQNQGYILYRYVLGWYHFLERLKQDHPALLIEGCSGGGGRFDAGMLYYAPQIWCSDNTDAIDRIQIQYGTSFGYPVSAVGSHVSAVPNEQTGRYTDIKTRAVVAMAGSFGYELDLNKVSEQDKEAVQKQIKECRKYWDLIHEGLYFRLTNPMKQREFAAWEFVAENGSEALLNVVTLDNHCNIPAHYVFCKGLSEEAEYVDEETGKVYSGSALMNGGIPLPFLSNEYQAWQVHLIRK